jgi:hypothetical protein
MNQVEHLTENQLSNYFGGTLENEKRREIGRHLLECDFCLKRLPNPTAEQFWQDLMTENEVDDRDADKTNFPRRLGFFTGLLTPPKVLAWSAGGMTLALIFSALVWFGTAKLSGEEREVAQAFDAEIAELKQNDAVGENSPPIVLASKSNDRSSSPEPSNSVVYSKPTNLSSQKRNPKVTTEKNSSRHSKKIIPSEKLASISSTRGVSNEKCGEENPIEMEIGSNNNESVTFKWAKVPNAVKYHLFISDDEEILVDEYETEDETEYVLLKTLDPLKTYKWKVVITLENGNISAGNSQKFTVKNLSQNQKKTGKKKSDVRCSENK